MGDVDDARTIQTDAHLAVFARHRRRANERSIGAIHRRRILREEDSTHPREQLLRLPFFKAENTDGRAGAGHESGVAQRGRFGAGDCARQAG